MENLIVAAIEELATLRNVSVDTIKNELRAGNDTTRRELFALSCAAAAIV